MKKCLALAVCLFAASLASAAAETWPTRPVKLIVGFAPGGPTDIFARLIGQKLAEATGQNFFVENLRGAGGNIGTGRAAQSAPDGYTALVTGGNLTNNPFLFDHVPFDPLKDFDAVTLGALTPVVLGVHPSVPAKSVKELVDLIRATPGKFSYASSARCSSTNSSSTSCTCRSRAAATRCSRPSPATRRSRSAPPRRQCR